MSIDYPALKAELDAGHPVTGAYDAGDQAAADELNLANIEVDKNTTPEEAADATNSAEFNTLTDADQQKWISVLSWATINLNGGIGLATAQGMWNQGATPVTKGALLASRKTNVSQASQIAINYSGLITKDHVTNARAV